MKTHETYTVVGDLAPTETLSPTDQELLEDASRNAAAARIPFSGGAEKALVFHRGAETAGRALSRVWTAARR
jgi:hypothetical protein